MQKKQSKTVGIILAGGAGSRLGGADKGLQNHKGKRLIDLTVSKFSPQVDDLVICANRNLSEYRDLGFDVVQDKQEISRAPFHKEPADKIPSYEGPTYEGPMAGISAALKHLGKSNFEYAAVVSCDVPSLPLTLIQQLKINTKRLVTVAHDGKRRQNLHCLIKREAWNSLIESFESGERAMHRWYQEVGIDEVDFSDQAESFLNINSARLLNK